MAFTKCPEFQAGHPIWWHLHGLKMRVRRLDLRNRTLTIGSRVAAVVRISPSRGGWHIAWAIKFGQEEKVRGIVWMSDQNLRCAFGLSDSEDERYGSYRHLLIERFGADCAYHGVFIRYRNFLNIPCPGTGYDGDPNVSIDLDDDIKLAIRRLLGE